MQERKVKIRIRKWKVPDRPCCPHLLYCMFCKHYDRCDRGGKA